jgi:uncharacterized phiE125 gp8 family phage protein
MPNPHGTPPGQLLHKPDGAFSTLITAPATALYTLDEVKLHCRIDAADEDSYLTSLIAVVTDKLDAHYGVIGKALITQRWQLTLRRLPGVDYLYLPVPPVQQVTSIHYYDVDNVLQEWANTNFRLIVNGESSLIELTETGAWPDVYDRSDAFYVQYDAGYGVASDVPAAIRHAGLLIIGELYRQRENTDNVSQNLILSNYAALIHPHRLTRSLF